MAGKDRVCSTSLAFHHLVGEGEAGEQLADIVRTGLLPASELPDDGTPERAGRLAFLRGVYEQVAGPVLGRPYANSGVFLTPIDFRHPALAGSLWGKRPMAGLARVAVPVSAIDAGTAIITWAEDEERAVRPLSPAALEEAADRWPAERVAAWFGRNPQAMFFYVPQLMCYQGRIDVRPEWAEPVRAG